LGNEDFKHARARGCDIIGSLSNILRRNGQQRVERIEDSLEEVGSPQHEGVVEATKVCAVAHFLSENVRGNAFAVDVWDGDATVFDPLPSHIFPMFNMTIALCGQIVAPFDASVVVIVEE
jgi:hypothetical protein